MLHAQVNPCQCEGGWDSSSLELGLGHLASLSPTQLLLTDAGCCEAVLTLHCDYNLLTCQNYYFLLEDLGLRILSH